MLEKIEKHSVKIFVFTVNILLAAIAVLLIREKDQARLLENAQKENPANENAGSNLLPSFENSVSIESADSNSAPADVPNESSPVDSETAAPTPPVPAATAPAKNASVKSDPTAPPPKKSAPSTPAPAPVPVVSAPAPAPTPAPSNAKTKTS